MTTCLSYEHLGGGVAKLAQAWPAKWASKENTSPQVSDINANKQAFSQAVRLKLLASGASMHICYKYKCDIMTICKGMKVIQNMYIMW